MVSISPWSNVAFVLAFGLLEWRLAWKGADGGRGDQAVIRGNAKTMDRETALIGKGLRRYYVGVVILFTIVDV
jgi:hypothetical protein